MKDLVLAEITCVNIVNSGAGIKGDWRVCTAGGFAFALVAYKPPEATSFSVPESNIDLREWPRKQDLYNVSSSSTAACLDRVRAG